ncbi:hypothetical protein ACFVVM_26090 [Nocardia sp. NPDC058176]|uniref:hypothetical protein n=1 Tax=Nocardia sp. NPDC058176 TaxID=3346368 RepID=UPI0036DB2EF2
MTTLPVSEDWVPDACTLPTVARPIRVAEFDRFFAESVRTAHRTSPTRLDLRLAEDAEAAARDLAARESGCCSFFTFDFDTTDTATVMRVDVPVTYVEVLDAFAARVDTAMAADSRQGGDSRG